MRFNLSPSKDEMTPLVSRMVRASLYTLSVETSDFRMSTFAALNPAVSEITAVGGDSVVYRGKLSLPYKSNNPEHSMRRMPVYGGMVRGERGGSLWFNFSAKDRFQAQRRFGYAGLSFAAQVLMEAYPLKNIPRVAVFEAYLRERNNFLRNPNKQLRNLGLSCPFLMENFNANRYVSEVRDSNPLYRDESISQVTKNYAFCLLRDLMAPGNVNLTDEQMGYFRDKYRNLLFLSDLWGQDIGTTRNTYSSVITTNKLMESLREAFYTHGVNIGDPVKLSVSSNAVSLNETDEEGKEFRDISSDVYEVTRGIGDIDSDEIMSAQLFLSNALLIAKDVLGAKVEKSVPTVFPGKKLTIDPAMLFSLLSNDMPEELNKATWISYDNSLNFVTGQYYIKASKYKHAGKLLQGSAKWMDSRISRGVFTIGNEDQVLGKMLLNGEQMGVVRRLLHPTFKLGDRAYRYLGYNRTKGGSDTYNWVEVDEHGSPVAIHAFSKEKHLELRDANPELAGYNTRGMLSLYSDLEKAINKQSRYSPKIDNYLTINRNNAEPPALSILSNTVLRNFHDTLAMAGNGNDALMESLGSILGRTYNDLVAPLNAADNGFGKLSKEELCTLDEDLRKQSRTFYSNSLVTHVIACKCEVIRRLGAGDANAFSFFSSNDKDFSLWSDVVEKEDPEALDLVAKANSLYAACEAEGVNLSSDNTLRANVRAMETLQLRQYAPLKSFRLALYDYYGKTLMENEKVPVFNPKKRSTEHMSLSAAAEFLSDTTVDNIYRELGFLSAISNGTPMDNKPISVEEAAKSIPGELLKAHINLRVSMAQQAFDYIPKKSILAYSPFSIFGNDATIKELCDKSQSVYLRDAKALHSLVPSAKSIPVENSVAEKSSSTVEVSTPAKAKKLPEIHDVSLPKESLSAFNALVSGINHGNPGMASVCEEALIAVCLGAMRDSDANKYRDLFQNEVSDSYASNAGLDLADKLNSDGNLFEMLKASGIVDELYNRVRVKKELISEPHLEPAEAELPAR